MEYDLDRAIRKVKDFPKKGILFYDITSIFTNPEAFAYTIERAIERYKNANIDKIVCIESRGFIFGAVLADRLKKPFALARKKGKLPGETISKGYTLEYGEAILEIQRSDIDEGDRVLIVDDLIATGGTIGAIIEMVKELGGSVFEIFGVIGLPFLGYMKYLDGNSIYTLIDYDSE